MKSTADLLCVLAMFSILTAFYKKALLYARCGYTLFPQDSRFAELYAYTLVLTEDYVSAESVLSGTAATTANLEYLRGRVAILLGMPSPEKATRLRTFLSYWTKAR